MPESFVFQTHSLNRYFGNVHALKDLSLEVPEASIFGFLGANGAGKTTTIRLLMGIIQCSSGEIEMFGSRAKGVSLKQRQMLSYVSQEQFFYPWIKASDLGKFVSGFYKTWDQRRFTELLDLFELPSKRRVDEMSGGMRTKLALALSIASRPKILILDEPTTGLDPIARREFMNLVVECSREDGRTVFFSSHLVNEVERFADHIGMIHHGQLLFQGSLDSVYSRIRKITVPTTEDQPEASSRFETWQTKELDGEVTQVLHAHDESWWEDNPDLSGARIEKLSLEDAFLASAGQLS